MSKMALGGLLWALSMGVACAQGFTGGNTTGTTTGSSGSSACNQVLSARQQAQSQWERIFQDDFEKTLGQEIEDVLSSCLDGLMNTNVQTENLPNLSVIDSLFNELINKACQTAKNKLGVNGVRTNPIYGVSNGINGGNIMKDF